MTELSANEWDLRITEIQNIAKRNALKYEEMRWYVFADFDGVVNLWDKPIEDTDISIKESDDQFLDRDCVKRLSDFCLELGGRLVISSSWRFKGLDYCREYLQRGGFSLDVPIVGTTELDYDNREIHITDYLLNHPDFVGYIVVDDIHLPHLSAHEIMCETQLGFDEEKFSEARVMAHKVNDMMEEYVKQTKREEMFAEVLNVELAK